MKTDFFFVYGTLKVGGKLAWQFDEVRTESVEAELEGYDLFNMGWFPAIFPGKGKVTGELHKYKDPTNVRNAMDFIEGYRPESGKGMYIRKQATVKTKTGELFDANIYVFHTDPTKHSEKIDSGVWKV
jgi:gamma-glutamylcyclotransferase (GGCT)/AIG2-like uncharacterized protein YtfP